jgi:short-subunit dehydrogenase
MRELKGKWGLVTGAAGGIGRAIALSLATRGMHLWLLDHDARRLREVCDAAHRLGVTTRPLPVDLSDLTQVDYAAHEVLVSRYGVDLLINNAGVAYYGGTHRMEDAEWERLLTINLHAPIRLTRRLLPLLRQRPEAHIVNMCSVAGLVAGGRFTAYHTSKFGLVGFTLALRAEYTRKGLGVTAVCPGPVRTELYRQCQTADGETAPEPPRWLSATPDQVAAATIRGIVKNRRQVVVTPLAHGLFQLHRFLPGLIDLVQTFSRRSLPWYRGKPLHIPTSFPIDPNLEADPGFPIALELPRSATTDQPSKESRRAA